MKKILIFLLLGLSGCIFAFQDISDPVQDKINFQMSKEEVLAVIGEPAVKKRVVMGSKEYEEWRYPVLEKTKKKFRTIGMSYYRILFSDDKVYEWDKVKSYAQPSYEFEKPEASSEDEVTTRKFFDNKIK